MKTFIFCILMAVASLSRAQSIPLSEHFHIYLLQNQDQSKWWQLSEKRAIAMSGEIINFGYPCNKLLYVVQQEQASYQYICGMGNTYTITLVTPKYIRIVTR